MKFAYLIMAHDNFRQLMILLKLLDSVNNDIYLHIDKKTRYINIDMLKNCVLEAKIHVYMEYDVKWAGISQTKCQMFLLEQAIQKYHDYYHLLSGHDLPLHCNDTIEKFFYNNAGKEFIHFESFDYCLKDNCRYYNLGNGLLSKVFICIQKAFRVNRKLYCGANWFSITHRLGCDLVKHKIDILRKVRFTISSDEYILQTFYRTMTNNNYVLYNTNVNDYSSVTRMIDWDRGSPYVWQVDDFYQLIDSGRMFARKFDERIDNEIIEKVVRYIDLEKRTVKKS
ncbi:beta-1,6-N-acetylglucosaminyltransferase [Selenomonas caprae]|uniref:Peptide O-xylosyltransferase n=1 Tax=Selenomonas caprae TaxID=2606905 RepID=A0A5D6WTX8_9FIRM|nr:beta-1,6-N-acetylglucosaminyltransferase [Selenomonas caprae]TYZ29824.1 beta-1,6-N-acetylglucosaminyltransferase [Selenomonas caprae]